MNYICPVCGYDLDEPPANYSICSSCGTEFGYDDFTLSHEELRRRWLAGGAKWWSNYVSPPPNWSPFRQLLRVTNPMAATDAQTHGETFTLPRNGHSSVETQAHIPIWPTHRGETLRFSASVIPRRRAA